MKEMLLLNQKGDSKSIINFVLSTLYYCTHYKHKLLFFEIVVIYFGHIIGREGVWLNIAFQNQG